MGRVIGPEVALDNEIHVLVGESPVSEPSALAKGDEHRPRGPVKPLYPGLQGTDGAELKLGGLKDGLLLGGPQLVGFALG